MDVAIAKKERLDRLLVDLRLAESRECARALIMEGRVMVKGCPVDKPGVNVDKGAEIHIRREETAYVSRGGRKLEGALDLFRVDPKGLIVMDAGASTGGFTDCVLQRGAKRVYAVDVG